MTTSETERERERRAVEEFLARQSRGVDVDRTLEEFLVERQRGLDKIKELRARIR